MTESIALAIAEFFQGKISKELIVFLVSMLPILELRGSLIVAGFLKMEFLATYITPLAIIVIPLLILILANIKLKIQTKEPS